MREQTCDKGLNLINPFVVGSSNHGMHTWKPLCIKFTIQRKQWGVQGFGGAQRCQHVQQQHQHHPQLDVMTSRKDNKKIEREGKGLVEHQMKYSMYHIIIVCLVGCHCTRNVLFF